MRRLAGWLAALALLAALPAAAAVDARAVLERMNRALHELDYVGTLVYAERGRMETMRVFHAVAGERERERIVSLTGEPREIVREDGRVTCIGSAAAPRSYAAAALPSLPSVSGAAVSGDLAHYELRGGEASRIAGRDALQVEIRARDAFRYSYRLWVDRESGLLLKSLRYGADGSTIDQLMFTDIDIGRRPDDADLRPSDAARPVAEQPASAAMPLASAAWTVRDLPPGFALTSLNRGEAAGEEHQVFSDGLASVSVYVEPHDGGQAAPSSTTRGAITAFSRHHDGFRVYVIGDVPERTAQRIAHGVVAARPAPAGG